MTIIYNYNYYPSYKLNHNGFTKACTAVKVSIPPIGIKRYNKIIRDTSDLLSLAYAETVFNTSSSNSGGYLVMPTYIHYYNTNTIWGTSTSNTHGYQNTPEVYTRIVCGIEVTQQLVYAHAADCIMIKCSMRTNDLAAAGLTNFRPPHLASDVKTAGYKHQDQYAQTILRAYKLFYSGTQENQLHNIVDKESFAHSNYWSSVLLVPVNKYNNGHGLFAIALNLAMISTMVDISSVCPDNADMVEHIRRNVAVVLKHTQFNYYI